MKSTLRQLTPLLVVFTVLLSSHLIDAAWTAPIGTPSESNNAPAPINVSTQNQLKLGDITALNLKAGAQVWSAEYCDENGLNCFSAADVTGGGVTYADCAAESRTMPSADGYMTTCTASIPAGSHSQVVNVRDSRNFSSTFQCQDGTWITLSNGCASWVPGP